MCKLSSGLMNKNLLLRPENAKELAKELRVDAVLEKRYPLKALSEEEVSILPESSNPLRTRSRFLEDKLLVTTYAPFYQYISLRSRLDLSAISDFPVDKLIAMGGEPVLTYAEYMEKKYKLKTENEFANLIEARFIWVLY